MNPQILTLACKAPCDLSTPPSPTFYAYPIPLWIHHFPFSPLATWPRHTASYPFMQWARVFPTQTFCSSCLECSSHRHPCGSLPYLLYLSLFKCHLSGTPSLTTVYNCKLLLSFTLFLSIVLRSSV